MLKGCGPHEKIALEVIWVDVFVDGFTRACISLSVEFERGHPAMLEAMKNMFMVSGIDRSPTLVVYLSSI